MANAVTHVILTIVLVDIFRDYLLKKKFPRYIVLIAGIFGLMPDIDIPLSWLYSLITGQYYSFHGGITHSIIIPIIFLLIGLFLWYRKGKRNTRIIFFVVSFAWFFHLLLDCSFGGYSLLLFPFYSGNFCPEFNIQQYASAIDAIILVLWLIHEEVTHKIKDYI